VLALPFEFWYLQTLVVVNAINGIRSTQRPLLDGAPDAGQSSDKGI